MTAIIHNLKPDDILTFLPGIGDEEYARRAKIRSMRNVAAAMIANTESNAARQLAWLCSEFATEAVYAPLEASLLDDVGKFCHRLMITAMHAERLETL